MTHVTFGTRRKYVHARIDETVKEKQSNAMTHLLLTPVCVLISAANKGMFALILKDFTSIKFFKKQGSDYNLFFNYTHIRTYILSNIKGVWMLTAGVREESESAI